MSTFTILLQKPTQLQFLWIFNFRGAVIVYFLEEEMRNQLSQRDDFYPQIVKLVIPIIIQNLLSAAVNSADVIMLNFVGQSSISAVSLAANYSNVLFMVYYGLGTGATLLCAQYYGKGDYKAIQIIEGIALRFSMIISILVALVAFTMPQMMMKLFTNDPELLAIGSSYIRIMGITYICWGMTEVYLAVLRSIGRVTVSMAMNMLAFGLNILLNATFIFGLFGAPKLGATGVAIATALSRTVELIACFIVSAFSKNVRLDLRYMFIKNKLLFSDFVRLSLPALGNDISWSVGFSMYSVILGHLGTDAVAAFSHGCLYRRFQCSHSNSRICHGKTIKQASFSCLSAFRSSSSWESAAFLQSSSGIYCFRLLQGKVNKQIFGTVVVLKFAENEHIKRH